MAQPWPRAQVELTAMPCGVPDLLMTAPVMGSKTTRWKVEPSRRIHSSPVLLACDTAMSCHVALPPLAALQKRISKLRRLSMMTWDKRGE